MRKGEKKRQQANGAGLSALPMQKRKRSRKQASRGDAKCATGKGKGGK